MSILPLKGVGAAGLYYLENDYILFGDFEWEVRRLHHLERGRWDHFRGRSRAVPLEGLLESSMETEALKWGAVGVGRAADNYTSRSGPGT